jgi:hypothetical protein
MDSRRLHSLDMLHVWKKWLRLPGRATRHLLAEHGEAFMRHAEGNKPQHRYNIAPKRVRFPRPEPQDGVERGLKEHRHGHGIAPIGAGRCVTHPFVPHPFMMMAAHVPSQMRRCEQGQAHNQQHQ